MRRFTALTENEALEKLNRHVEALETLEEIHGLKEILSPNMSVPEMLVSEGLREEVERLLEERKVMSDHEPSWSRTTHELELTRQMLRFAVMKIHDAHHGDQKTGWRQCRNTVCLYTQMVLPEIEDVQWA
jgi:hypothetical protein